MPSYGGPSAFGAFTALNISVATVVKAGKGVAITGQVITAGTTVGSVNDAATIGGVATANQVAPIPNTVGFFAIQMPCATGITVSPGTGQTVAISYD